MDGRADSHAYHLGHGDGNRDAHGHRADVRLDDRHPDDIRVDNGCPFRDVQRVWITLRSPCGAATDKHHHNHGVVIALAIPSVVFAAVVSCCISDGDLVSCTLRLDKVAAASEQCGDAIHLRRGHGVVAAVRAASDSVADRVVGIPHPRSAPDLDTVCLGRRRGGTTLANVDV